jgi:nitrite reductase/ring-hydroxylating ferredoxin subunit
VFRLNISDFPALASAGGSVRFGGSEITSYFQNGVERTQAASIFPTFFVNRPTSAQTFVSHAAECTHEGCIIDSLVNSVHVCPCHGSRFNNTGRRLSGPANSDLPKYEVVAEPNGVLAVILPGSMEVVLLQFEAAQTVVPPGANRLKISFPSYSGMTYEVRYRSFDRLVNNVVPHADTPTGAADSLSVGGIDDILNVYIDAPPQDGMIQVGIVITEV